MPPSLSLSTTHTNPLPIQEGMALVAPSMPRLEETGAEIAHFFLPPPRKAALILATNHRSYSNQTFPPFGSIQPRELQLERNYLDGSAECVAANPKSLIE